jgi:T-complex protein 1 subunit theta
LQNAEELLKRGIHPSEIISGYTIAQGKALEYLEGTILCVGFLIF